MQSEFMNDIHKVEISAIKKIGFKKVFNLTTKLIEKSQSKFSTSQLNNLLEKFLISSSPPSVGGRTLKFKHVHFAGICPTTLIINANQDKKIPRNYKKYLENSFKESLDLKSIQLRLIFKKSENPYANKKNQLTDRQVKKRKRLIKYKNKLKK